MTLTLTEPAPPPPTKPQPSTKLQSRAEVSRPATPLWHRYRATLIGYLLPAVVSAAVTVAWFRPGRFVAAGDVSPFLRDNLAREWWSLWSHQLTGAGSTSYDSGRGVEVALLALAHFLGASPVIAQCALFAACCALAAYGTAFFVGSWVRNPWFLAVSGLFGAFNAFEMVNLPDLLPAVTIGMAGLIGGLILRRAAGRSVRATTFALATLPLCYVSLNPPLLAVIICWAVLLVALATPIAGRGATVRAGRLTLAGGALATVLNSWWIVPFLIGTLAPAGVSFSAQTDVQAWGWSQARNSIGNVLTLNTHWGWKQVEYFPYAGGVDHGPLGWARWVFPGLALCGFLLPRRQHRRTALVLLATLGSLVFVAKGLHAPASSVNLWMYDHLPGMWLLREPMSKVGPLIVLLEATGAALALDRFARWVSHSSSRSTLGLIRDCALNGALAALVVAGLAYPWPLWTGAVVPNARAKLPGSSVKVPAGWYRLAAATNQRTGHGSVLVLPLDPFYQVTTSWGYHGVDSIPQQLLDRPVLQQLPGGYFSNQPAVQALMSDVERGLLARDTAFVQRRLQALGVSAVIVRGDLVRGPTDSPFADPLELAAGMDSVPGARLIARSKLGSVFGVGSKGIAMTQVQTYSSLLAAPTSDPEMLSATVASMPPGVVTTDSPRAAVDGLTWQVTDQHGSSSFVIARAGHYSLSYPATAQSVYVPTISRLPDGEWGVTLDDPSRITLDGSSLSPRPAIRLPATADRPVAIGVNGSMEVLSAGSAVRVNPGDSITVFTAATPANRLGAPDGTGDCDRSQTSPTGDLSAVPAPQGVTLAATSGLACAWWDLPDTPRPVMVTADAKSLQGAPAQLCLWSPAQRQCESSDPPVEDKWTGFVPAGDASPVQVFAYASGMLGGTRTVYDHVTDQPLQAEATTTAATAPTAEQVVSLNAGQHQINFDGFLPAQGLGALSPLTDCDSRSATPHRFGQVTSMTGGVQLRAWRDTACVSSVLQTSSLASRYRLTLDYRTASGEPARVCVWEIGPDRCASIPQLTASTKPQHLDTSFVPDEGTRGLELYLYADSDPGSTVTETDYSNFHLTPADPFVIVVAPVDNHAASTRPNLASSCQAGACEVRVLGASGPFVLTLNQSWDPGWNISGLPRGWQARHIEVDGYANGWQVSGRGSALLTLAYSPDRYVHWAHWASGGAAVLIAGLMLYGRRRNASGHQPAHSRRRT